MGHSSVRMTERYAHHYPESVRHGVEVLDRLNAMQQSEKKAENG